MQPRPARSRGGGGNCGGRGMKSAATKAAQKAKLAAFLRDKYGASGSKMAAQLGTSTNDDVECLGEKTYNERDAELRSEAVPLDADSESD